jgi:hypothetical protein
MGYSFSLCRNLQLAVANEINYSKCKHRKKENINKINWFEFSRNPCNAAVKFLKDNGVDALANNDSPLKRLAQVLPFADNELNLN